MKQSFRVESHTRVRASPSVHVRPFGDELVLLDFALGEYFALDEIGAEIYRRIEAGATVAEIAAAVAARWEVAPERAKADVVELVTRLLEAGLVKEFDEPRV